MGCIGGLLFEMRDGVGLEVGIWFWGFVEGLHVLHVLLGN